MAKKSNKNSNITVKKSKELKIANVNKGKEGEMGTYTELRGGGTPTGNGTKYPNGAGRGGWTKANQPGHREEEQPRTEDGKFTYNSVNGKKREYEYHGKYNTVNPLLTGGKNGVNADEFDKQMREKEGDYWDKYGGKGKDFYIRGSKRVVRKKRKYVTQVSEVSIAKISQNVFNIKLGKFEGEGDESNWKTKLGRKSKEEKAAAIKMAKKPKLNKSYIYKDGTILNSNKEEYKTPTPVPKGYVFSNGAIHKVKQPKITPFVPKSPQSIISNIPNANNSNAGNAGNVGNVGNIINPNATNPNATNINKLLSGFLSQRKSNNNINNIKPSLSGFLSSKFNNKK